jgi:hypothetical protein
MEGNFGWAIDLEVDLTERSPFRFPVLLNLWGKNKVFVISVSVRMIKGVRVLFIIL